MTSLSLCIKLAIALVVVILVELVLVYSAVADRSQDAAGAQPSSSHHHANEAPTIETLRAFDSSDERKLVGFADNVFVGRIEDKVGNEPMKGVVREDADSPEGPPPSIPETQFSVEVLDNVKGSLQGRVTVSQSGGDVPSRDAPVTIEHDPILRPGQTVLFATRFDEDEGHHQVVAPVYGDVRIGGAEERARVVERFEAAREDQVDPLPELPE